MQENPENSREMQDLIAENTANIFGSAHQGGHENFVWGWSQETEWVVRIGEQDAELEALRAREQQTEVRTVHVAVDAQIGRRIVRAPRREE